MEAFPAFKERNFRLYFWGMFISFAGTWMQHVALGWLVFKLTQSPFWVGAVASLGMLPSVILAPLGGTIVDRYPKRYVMYMTQGLSMIQALVLGLLTVYGLITIERICILSIISGFIVAVDYPARQAIVRELVSPENLPSAMALNISMMTLSDIFGPMLGGFLIIFIGEGGTFIVNAASFLAVIVALWMINIDHEPIKDPKHPFRMVAVGFRYTFCQPGIRLPIIFGGLVMMFGFSFRSILPVVTKELFNGGPKVLGYLSASHAVGAFIGTVLVSAFAKKVSLKFFLLGGSLLTALSLMLFSRIHILPNSLLFIVTAGIGLTLCVTLVRAVTLQASRRDLTGVVSGFTNTLSFGGVAFGNSLTGFVADKYGSAVSIGLNGSVLLLLVLFFWLHRAKFKPA
ncbi:MFS transporter [Candidatus Parcubacteria bacterium]|nr:MFS transporter [Candidatus Parcubacteria bacterium]